MDLELKGNKSLSDKSESESIWASKLQKVLGTEDKFRKEGKRIIEIYENESVDGVPFNILYSNTATLTSALYSNLPRVVVGRRYDESDPAGMAAAEIVRKALTYILDDNSEENSPMDSLFSTAVLQALLPGRGVIRFKYEAEISGEAGNYSEGESSETEEVENSESIGTEKVESEYLCAELVPWDRIILAPSVSWKKMPWAAIIDYFTEEEFKKEFPDFKGEVSFDAISGNIPIEGKDAVSNSTSEGTNDLVKVFEVFDKIEKKIYFISPSNNEGKPLKTLEDSLKLSGFYPFCEPLIYVPSVSSNIPKALYSMYEVQANELNLITKRISAIISALKVRGFYDGSLTELDKLLESDDNTLIAVTNAQQLVDRKLTESIWLMPLDELIIVLQQLYRQRDEIKQNIYEISGLGDIMRGVSEASETATAQNLKSKWGTLRLRDLQKNTAKFIRNSLRIAAEIIVTSFSKETLQNMTGVKLPEQEKKQLLLMQVQMMQSQGQEIPPDMQMMLQIPTWEEVMAILKNDTMRQFKLDLETNSTIDNEISEDKAEISEFLNAIAQFMNSVAPLIADGTMPFEAAKIMLLSITKKFRFGDEVEKSLRALQAPQQSGSQEEVDQAMQQLQQEREAFEADKVKAQRELETQKAQLELEKQRQEALLNSSKQAALREIDLSKKMAMREISQEAMASKHESDMHTFINESKVKVKQKLATDQINAEKSRVTELVKLLEDTHQARMDLITKKASDRIAASKDNIEDSVEDTYYGGA